MTTSPTMQFSDYSDQGFITLPPPLTTAQLDALRDDLERWAQDAPPAHNAYGILKNNLYRDIPLFFEVLLEGNLARIAAALLDLPEVVLFQDNLIWKPPQTTSIVQWHQDYAYWPLSAPDGVTFWLAIDDATLDNGCLYYIPGTHQLGERQPTNFITPGAASWRQDLPPLDVENHEHRAIAAPLKAGQLLAHHPLCWHMSPGNLSAGHRRGWSLTWIAPSVCWATAHAPHPFTYSLAPTDGQPPRGEPFLRFTADGAAI